MSEVLWNGNKKRSERKMISVEDLNRVEVKEL